jgi:hypothetical protein
MLEKERLAGFGVTREQQQARRDDVANDHRNRWKLFGY